MLPIPKNGDAKFSSAGAGAGARFNNAKLLRVAKEKWRGPRQDINCEQGILMGANTTVSRA